MTSSIGAARVVCGGMAANMPSMIASVSKVVISFLDLVYIFFSLHFLCLILVYIWLLFMAGFSINGCQAFCTVNFVQKPTITGKSVVDFGKNQPPHLKT